MIGSEPLTLWRYCKNLDYAIETLRNNTVFLASPESFEDLQDCRFVPNPDVPASEKLATLSRYFKQLDRLTPEEARKKAKEVLDDPARLRDFEQRAMTPGFFDPFRSTLGVYCMSESRDDPVLWGSYADKHTGICIGFCAQASRSDRAGLIPGVPGALVLQVHYCDGNALPTVKLYNNDPRALYPIVTTKSKEWCYEREWRIVLPIVGACRKMRLPSGSISDVMLGAKITKENRKAIADAARKHQPQARLHQA